MQLNPKRCSLIDKVITYTIIGTKNKQILLNNKATKFKEF